MFTKIIILCAASACFLYSVMYAVISSYYRRSDGSATNRKKNFNSHSIIENSIAHIQ